MNTIDSTISSSKENPYIKKVKSNNERLVRILNHKMFKGYREIKESKEYFLEKPKYIRSDFWENRIIDPFDDNYNIEYKRKNLSSFFNKDLSDMLQINNYSIKKDLNKKNSSKNIKFRKKSKNQKKNNFRKIQNINLYLKKKPCNDKYFYFNSKSLLIRNDIDNNIQKKEKLFKTIFSGEKEKGLYNDIPIFAIEKIYKINDNKKKKFIYLPSKEERMSDLQFLYKVSHKSPTKKVDFRNKYNIKSAKERKKTNETMQSAVLTSIPQKIQSAKPNKNRLTLKRSNSDVFMTNIKKNNCINRMKNKSTKCFDNDDFENKQFHNIILKRAQSSSAYKSRNIRSAKNFSKGVFDISKDVLLNKDNNKESNVIQNYFPSINRFVNDQIVLNYINYKKSQFENLKNLIEY